ncbi:MAG: apolipoprotein N-acyltransferase [Hyphomicrobiaceae bacterium]|nr:MAG: apolipoprotein N-acyltransferase [Hyphomicrobiaceae bacterium]
MPKPIAALAERVRNLGGWRRRAAALSAGIASVLAMAPFFAWPVLWLTLPVLVWLIDGAVAGNHAGGAAVAWYRRPAAVAAEVGWWFGFGYFVTGLFWIGEAFLVEAEIFAALLPFAVTLLPAGLALFYAAAAGMAASMWRPGAPRVLALALALSAAEWLRGHVLTGFPWNVLGYAITHPLALMQSATVLGIYGLTLIAVLIFALPPVLWVDAPEGQAGRRARRAAIAIAVVPLLLMAALGVTRLALAAPEMVAGIKIRIVQPSVPQREKWRPENQEKIFLDHLALSAAGADGTRDQLAGITHVIWPEAAMPFLPLDHPGALAAIGRLLPPGTFLLTGALRAEPAPPGAPRPRRVFNSLLVLGEGGSLVTLYDKIHLVPFGEYLPFQRQLEAIGLQQLTRLRGGFDIGTNPRPLLHVPRLPAAGPLICYEAIFPRAIVQGSERPGLLVNLTNDGWFGNTIGPRQHFHQARVRAVEEGLPLMRVANNGISAAIDGYGRVLARLDLNARGVIDVGLPAALAAPVYARFGDAFFLLLWLLGAAALALRR